MPRSGKCMHPEGSTWCPPEHADKAPDGINPGGPIPHHTQEGRTLAEPFHKIQEDNIQASIWKNEGGSEGHYFTVSLTKTPSGVRCSRASRTNSRV